MLAACLYLLVITAIAGAALVYSDRCWRAQDSHLVDKINAILPQTQCAQCDYPGCRPYAEAIAAGKADINQCPPGGETGIQLLAELLNVQAKPLNAQHGEHKPPMLAVIDEARCIGCKLCIQACPVDAIVGAAKRMHTVIADECTGCELCLPPCPVDCIDLIQSAMPKQPVELAYLKLSARSQAEVVPQA